MLHNKFFVLLLVIGGVMQLFSSPRPVEMNLRKGICSIEGALYPAVGFGTYPLTGQVCTTAVQQALKAGYRILDTATFYQNFPDIAKALKGQVRSHFYLISKVWPDRQSPADLRCDVSEALEQLQTPYLDAYFLHFPNSEVPIEPTLKTLDELRQSGKIRHIGLSNVSVNHLKRALEVGVPITWVQIEMHPQFFDPNLLKFCQEHSIGVQAWAPLGRGRISEDQELEKIGKKYGKTASQVALRWILQHGVMPLPGSKNERHMVENLSVTNFVLSEKDMTIIDRKAACGQRERVTKDDFGFADEFDFVYEECWPKI